MKFWEVLRFELAYQLRRPWPWLCAAILFLFAFELTRAGTLPVTLPQDFILNSPFLITTVTVLSCQIWLLIAPALAGDAAARDVQTGMHPLMHSSSLHKAEYLGGRFLAAFVLHALVLLAVQLGGLLAVYGPWTDPAIVGPFRPAAYLAAYGYIALSNVFIATTFQFSAALLAGRPMASYAGSIALFFLSYPVTFALYMAGLGKRALLADPIGVLAIMNEMMSNWTIAEKNVRMFTLEGAMLYNRLLWLGVALAAAAVVYTRFRFAHITASEPFGRLRRHLHARIAAVDGSPPTIALQVPQVRQSFGFATHIRQTLSLARSSFWMIARSPAGLFLLVVFPLFTMLVLLVESEHWGVRLLPRTGFILAKHLTAPLTEFTDYRVIVPLLIVYFAGELIWRERDAQLSENVDAMPVPDWALFLGKFSGLGLVLAALMVSMSVTAMLGQTLMAYHDYQIGLYVQFFFGLQLPEYLLFAVLALAVQAAVNQKYLGHLVALAAYFLIVFAPFLGIEHKLLIYSAGPDWYFTDMRGFGHSLGPWLWFKLYWAAWALLLTVLGRLLWVRGRESGLITRLRLAGSRVTRATAGAAALALVLILTLGGFIFYNTNVLNEYITEAELVQRRADYERRYGRYEGIPQPQRVATSLQVDIKPERGAASLRGSYRLVNRSAVPIDSVHVEPGFHVDTRITLDRASSLVVSDEKLGHFIYALHVPLQPGDSLTLNFDVGFEPAGFRSRRSSLLAGGGRNGAGPAILQNGTYFTSAALPVIGYQPTRELWSAADRRKHGLPRQLTLAPVGDIGPNVVAVPPATFEAIVSTAADQVAVAPGQLRRTWSADGRRYFHYHSGVPINGTEVFFSANYFVHRETWRHVDVQVYLHAGHARHVERVLRSVRASLEYYSAQFGAYPYPFLQIVEQPGNFLGMGVDGSGVVTGGEGFFMFDPQGDGFDAMFEIVAHELGHQWWGMQLKPAFAEGGGVISESLAWYSAIQLVKHEKGREALRRFMSFMRQPSPWPAIRTGLPLLRAMDPWANYRKGPYALHALSEYAGEERVNAALRSLIEKKKSTLATTLDMYRELQAVTPDSLRALLHDLFEVNAFWSFDTKKATTSQIASGAWQVTLEVDAHKTVADSAGREVERPIDEWIEIGVFAAAGPGEKLGKPLYLRRHRIRSGTQTITLQVPEKPARGGIDPYSLLDWEEGDNIEPIEVEQTPP